MMHPFGCTCDGQGVCTACVLAKHGHRFIDPALGVDEQEEQRYRLYRRRGRNLVHMASTSRDGIGLTLVTLHDEGQWDDRDRVGIMDDLTRAWIVDPFVSGEAPDAG